MTSRLAAMFVFGNVLVRGSDAIDDNRLGPSLFRRA